MRSPVDSFSALQRAEIAEIGRLRAAGLSAAGVSVLFNEPKLLKFEASGVMAHVAIRFSALQRAEIAEMVNPTIHQVSRQYVSVLFNEPKLLKLWLEQGIEDVETDVSVLFNEPKLLKSGVAGVRRTCNFSFQCYSTSRNC